MKKIFDQSETEALSGLLQRQNRKVVLAGGCFDLLHPGHLAFLKAAKDTGDILIVLLESDSSITKLKGVGRPIQPQLARAQALSTLSIIDYIILLRETLSNKEYDELILALKPAIIATTEGDNAEYHKKRQAELSGAKLLHVIKRLPEYSTSRLVQKVKNL